MNARIVSGLAKAKLLSSLPRDFRSMMPTAVLEDDAHYTLLLFRHGRNDVVLSSTVRSALSRLPSDHPERLVAVGGSFTIEAEAMLNERSAAILQRTSFWTDEMYRNIRRGK